MLKDPLSDNIQFISIRCSDKLTECGIEFEVINIHSTKKEQLGFKAVIKEHGKKSVMVCLGDEPCHSASEGYVKNADWLLAEAFCLRSEKEIFHPYEKSHSTAYDAGQMAERLGVKNLVLYHTEDSDLENRLRKYSHEARLSFNGTIYVPEDLEVINIT